MSEVMNVGVMNVGQSVEHLNWTKLQGETCNCLNLSLEYFIIQHLNMLIIDEKGFKITLFSLTVLLNGVW